jgi:hypothetical protein
MQFPPRSSPPRSVYGGSLVPVLIVVAALLLSTAIFFLFTKKKIQAQKDAVAEKAASSASPVKTATPAVPPAPPPTVKPPKPAPPAFAFARPLDLGRQLVRSLTTGDFATAGKLAAASDAAQSDSAAKLFEKLASMGFKPAAEDQVELLGLVENRTRITLWHTIPCTRTCRRHHRPQFHEAAFCGGRRHRCAGLCQ